ncbi:MAG TPA: flippase [Gemmatimonadaceae bacterium]|nr:flippase [Gemmatimonadaceae bacterium]
MSDSRRLAHNTALNFAGQVAPMAAALVSTPLLIHGLGIDRFGVLTLAWVIVGYFGFVDLGLGRALTHAVASRLGSQQEEELETLGWTALMLMFALGTVGALVLTVATPALVGRVMHIPDALQPETTRAFYILAASLPIVVSTAGFRGIIEAHQHFGIATALRIPLAVFSYVAPLAVLPFTKRLDAVILVLVLGRFMGWAAHFTVCIKRYWFLSRRIIVRRHVVLPLLRVGGWMTVSNVVSPLMTYVDRFFVSARFPMADVAYYGTPYDAVSKLLTFPTAVVGVLFPAFAESFAKSRERTIVLFNAGIRTMLIVLFPAVLILVTLPHEILLLWIRRADVAQAGAPVLQWIAVGVLINAVGYVGFVALQGVGRADLTGKLNLLELPLYIAALWTLGSRFGLPGVAMAWTLRVTVDTTMLCILSARFLGAAARPSLRSAIWVFLAAALGAGAALDTTRERLLFTVVILLAYVPTAWFLLISREERGVVRALLANPFDRNGDSGRRAA